MPKGVWWKETSTQSEVGENYALKLKVTIRNEQIQNEL
jgi:hypothetical protein